MRSVSVVLVIVRINTEQPYAGIDAKRIEFGVEVVIAHSLKEQYTPWSSLQPGFSAART